MQKADRACDSCLMASYFYGAACKLGREKRNTQQVHKGERNAMRDKERIMIGKEREKTDSGVQLLCLFLPVFCIFPFGSLRRLPSFLLPVLSSLDDFLALVKNNRKQQHQHQRRRKNPETRIRSSHRQTDRASQLCTTSLHLSLEEPALATSR